MRALVGWPTSARNRQLNSLATRDQEPVLDRLYVTIDSEVSFLRRNKVLCLFRNSSRLPMQPFSTMGHLASTGGTYGDY